MTIKVLRTVEVRGHVLKSYTTPTVIDVRITQLLNRCEHNGKNNHPNWSTFYETVWAMMQAGM